MSVSCNVKSDTRPFKRLTTAGLSTFKRLCTAVDKRPLMAGFLPDGDWPHATLNGLPLRQKAVVRRRTSTTYSSVVPAKLSIEELVEIYPKGAFVFVLQP